MEGIKGVVIMLLIVITVVHCGYSQVAKSSNYTPVDPELYAEINRADSLMFVAFNAHDLDGLMAYFDEGLEFFHDKGGLSDYRQTKEGFSALFRNNQQTGLRRDLVVGSMEVYPISNYGAVATSQHRFCHREGGKMDCGTFKNIMVWKKVNNEWKVTRVISYDH